MQKKIKWVIFLLIFLILGGTLSFYIWKSQTKSHSPEQIVKFRKEQLQLEVFYNQPYKKGREIFGSLVPYGEVWRTGANEATTFKTNRDLLIDGSVLKAGKYTLWTIPGKNSWKVIFNSKMYAWGIELTSQKAARDPKHDILTVEIPVKKAGDTKQQFTIYFEKGKSLNFFNLSWDQVLVQIPFKRAS